MWHPGTLTTLRAERRSARMSKITNDGLTGSGTGCFIAVPTCQQWASKCKIRLQRWNWVTRGDPWPDPNTLVDSRSCAKAWVGSWSCHCGVQRSDSVCADLRHGVRDKRRRQGRRTIPTIRRPLLPCLQHHPSPWKPLHQPLLTGRLLTYCCLCLYLYLTLREINYYTYMPSYWHRRQCLVFLTSFGKNVIFVTTTPIDIKTNRNPGHGLYASACQISPSYDAASRRSLETEKINRLSIII